MSLVKKLKVFHLLCFSKIDRENVCADVLDKKEGFTVEAGQAYPLRFN